MFSSKIGLFNEEDPVKWDLMDQVQHIRIMLCARNSDLLFEADQRNDDKIRTYSGKVLSDKEEVEQRVIRSIMNNIGI